MPCDFVLLGPTGFLGAAILQALEKAGYVVATSRARLQDRLGIEKFLDENRPSISVICAAGERGRPNISWCDTHPVETVDANITGQLGVAAACHARDLHVILLGTGAFYTPDRTTGPRAFQEDDPPNLSSNVYLALRVKLEELISYFNNALILRVLYPVSSDMDKRGLVGKLAGFQRVDRVETSVTILEDLCPLVPEIAKRKTTGVLNFVNKGTVAYADIVEELTKRAPSEWTPPRIADAGESAARSACELDVQRLAAACGCEVPDATTSVRRIIAALPKEAVEALVEPRGQKRSQL